MAAPRGTRRRASQSTLGRIAAAMMNAPKRRAMSTFSFHSARAATTTAPITSAAIAARAAVWRIGRVFAAREERKTAVLEPDERICWESRRHAVVLAKPLARSTMFGVLGFVLF